MQGFETSQSNGSMSPSSDKRRGRRGKERGDKTMDGKTGWGEDGGPRDFSRLSLDGLAQEGDRVGGVHQAETSWTRLRNFGAWNLVGKGVFLIPIL